MTIITRSIHLGLALVVASGCASSDPELATAPAMAGRTSRTA